MLRCFNIGIKCDVNGNPLHPPRCNSNDIDNDDDDDKFNYMFDICPQPLLLVVMHEVALDFEYIFDCSVGNDTDVFERDDIEVAEYEDIEFQEYSLENDIEVDKFEDNAEVNESELDNESQESSFSPESDTSSYDSLHFDDVRGLK